MAIHLHPTQIRSLESPPSSQASTKSTQSAAFQAVLNSVASNKPSQRTASTTAASASSASSSSSTSSSSSSTSSTSSASTTSSTAATTPTSSDGTSLANLMAAASYAGVPYADLETLYNGGTGSYNANWQTNLANALESRLQSVSSSSASNTIYDPDPTNDNYMTSTTNIAQFTSSADQIQSLLNNMWSQVHAGSVSGYHTALQQVDAWFKSNGEQNYYTGLTDAQVAAYNPSNTIQPADMPNANASVATAELAAITGKSTAVTNLGSVAATASSGTIST